MRYLFVLLLAGCATNNCPTGMVESWATPEQLKAERDALSQERKACGWRPCVAKPHCVAEAT